MPKEHFLTVRMLFTTMSTPPPDPPHKPSWPCRLGFHKWSKYQRDHEMTITQLPFGVDTDGMRGASRPATLLVRTCQDCGLIQYKVVRS